MSAGTTDILLQPEIYEAVIAELKTVRLYIELARAKSEALDNIYSLFKQNIKLHVQHSFFVHNFPCLCFTRLKRETSFI